jgi:hypothetical protein
VAAGDGVRTGEHTLGSRARDVANRLPPCLSKRRLQGDSHGY